MALVHDMAEAIVGDITPADNVPKDVKAKKEDVRVVVTFSYLGHFLTHKDAFKELRDILGTEIADEMYALFREYEDHQTKESILVHQMDKLDMVMQANEYAIDVRSMLPLVNCLRRVVDTRDLKDSISVPFLTPLKIHSRTHISKRSTRVY